MDPEGPTPSVSASSLLGGLRVPPFEGYVEQTVAYVRARVLVVPTMTAIFACLRGVHFWSKNFLKKSAPAIIPTENKAPS